MEVLKRIELRDYQTYLYEDSSSLEEYWNTKKKIKTFGPATDVFELDDTEDNESTLTYYSSRQNHWKFKSETRTEKDFLENYGNPVASVRLKKVVLVLEKSEEKISLKFEEVPYDPSDPPRDKSKEEENFTIERKSKSLPPFHPNRSRTI